MYIRRCVYICVYVCICVGVILYVSFVYFVRFAVDDGIRQWANLLQVNQFSHSCPVSTYLLFVCLTVGTVSNVNCRAQGFYAP